MFIGHYAVALATKTRMPRLSLGVLVAATSLLDLIWPLLLLAGWERVAVDPGNTVVTPLNFVHYPITHSLLGATGWAVLAGLCYWLFTRYRTGAMVVAAVVLSHWFLDLIVHGPDLPLYPGSAIKLGFGLWNSVPGTVIVESGLFAFGGWLYASGTVAHDRTGRYGFWSFMALLVLIYVANLLGPPPPSAKVVAYSALGLWVLPFWAEWFDRHRSPEPAGSS